jgi:hypothetical protein
VVRDFNLPAWPWGRAMEAADNFPAEPGQRILPCPHLLFADDILIG